MINNKKHPMGTSQNYNCFSGKIHILCIIIAKTEILTIVLLITIELCKSKATESSHYQPYYRCPYICHLRPRPSKGLFQILCVIQYDMSQPDGYFT